MKRPAILLVILITMALIAGFLMSRRPPAPATTREPVVVPVDPPPRTIEFPAMPGGTQFTYEGPSVEFPLAVMAYRATPIIDSREGVEARALSLAGQFGFTASPSAFWRGSIFSASWETDPTGLSVSFSKDVLSFSLSQRRTAPTAFIATSAQQAIGLAASFVPLPTGAAFRAEPMDAAQGFDGVVLLDGPGGLTGHRLELDIVGTPVLNSEYQVGWGQVVADSSGVVRVFSAIFPFRSIVPAGEVPLISLSDAVTNLNAGRGAVLSVTDNFSPPGYGATPVITRAVIREVSLVYAPEGEILRPAYLLTGSGEDRGVVQQFTALVFASAN